QPDDAVAANARGLLLERPREIDLERGRRQSRLNQFRFEAGWIRHLLTNRWSQARGRASLQEEHTRDQRRKSIHLQWPHPSGAISRMEWMSSPGSTRSITSNPATTRPKTVYAPSRCGCGACVMKNWLPPVSGPARAMPIT